MFDPPSMDYKNTIKASYISMDRKENKMITVSIDLNEYAEGTIEQRIIAAVSAGIIDHLEKRVNQLVEEIVTETTEAEIRKQTVAAVNQILNDQIPVMNDWGRPSDKTQSFRDYLVMRTEKIVRGKVDSDGRVTNSSYSSNQMFVEWCVKNLAYKQVEQIKKDVTSEIVSKIGDGTRSAIVESVTQAVLKTLAK